MVKSKNSNAVLYRNVGEDISVSDVEKTLRTVGVKKGDVIFVHSDVSVFGKLVNFDRGSFFEGLIGALKNSVGGSGTIIMPAFTYSFTKNEIFDVGRTPSVVGSMAEYFRKMPGVKRTIEPMLSVAIFGKEQKYLSQIGHDVYGRDSVFDLFHGLNGKILLFGSRACTFFHHVERMRGVPYRFEKKVRGKIKMGNKIYEDEFVFYARRLGMKNVSHFSIAFADLDERGLIKKISLGDSKVALVDSEVLYREVFRRLDKDSSYYLRSNLSEKEEGRLE